MMFRYKILSRTVAFTVLGIVSTVIQTGARESIQTAHHKTGLKTSETRCLPAVAAIDLDINNVRARLMTGGDMWWNIGQQAAAYEVPKGSGKSSQFAASCWIGGFDQQKNLKVAAQMYRQDGNDYWPGALDGNVINKDQCNNWDRFWKVNRATINHFIELTKNGQNTTGAEFDAINQWPATGNVNAKGSTGTSLGLSSGIYSKREYAPFKDLNSNGVYEPGAGEYPLITGDQYIWWVFNDAGNVKNQSNTASIGIEVQTSAFAYATQDFLNDATFCQYRVWNYGALTMDSTYIAVWDDADLGWAFDDFIGCDTSRGLGILYNGTNDDGGGGGHPPNSYGLNPPQIGLDFFQGPVRKIHRGGGLPDTLEQLKMTNFTYFNNDASIIGNPTNGQQIYNYMTGSIRDGERFSYDFNGPGVPSKGYGAGPASNFVFWGDPGTGKDWSECTCNNSPYDRRFIFSSGPFQLEPGAKNDIIFGCVWVPNAGGCPATSFKQIRNVDDGAQALFDNHFKTVEGPEAPRLVVRELDRRLVFYMVNDYGSNNYGENYGRDDGTYKDSIQYHQTVAKASGVSKDTLYHFQGYRVFQLADGQVSADQIFDAATGEVDKAKAYEVFECDKQDGVTQIVNYIKKIPVSDTTWVPQVKVEGKDSGILHSFEITQDQFAKTADKRLINYHNYYFVAIAYGYNGFAKFDPLNSNATQDVAYLGSVHAHSIDGKVPVVAGMPNSANGAMGTEINTDYGAGIAVHRIEGQGNGGNYIQLDSASEITAVHNNKVDEAVYLPNQGPIQVKVVDPVIVPAYDWTLQIKDTANAVTFGATWMLTAKKGNMVIDTIYSETNLNTMNEQILEKYGISISLAQHYAPSQFPPAASAASQKVDNNGYIGSDITFADQSKSWLWGVQDQADSNFSNWIRSGSATNSFKGTNPCDFNDNGLDLNGSYENMMANFSPTKSTWAPYDLVGVWNKKTGNGDLCAMLVSYSNNKYNTSLGQDMGNLPDVNLVFTSDKSLWTRCAVIEMQEDTTLAEGGAPRFTLRRHGSWNGKLADDGITPIFATPSDSDSSMSYFPGYAVDQNTGRRLNIVFGEDSYLTGDNGKDMLWNPSPNWFNMFDGTMNFGGKHVTYILNSAYDSDRAFVNLLTIGNVYTNVIPVRKAYTPFAWVGIPLTNKEVAMKNYGDGYIPTTTTLRFRVQRPFATYKAVSPMPSDTIGLGGFPYYTFSTNGLSATPLNDTSNKSNLLSKIYAVPNPYYGFSGYEQISGFDTKVRIINLPKKAVINIYALDGTLIRTITKDDPNTSYIDWDVRNSVGLPIASGMYLMHVVAEGIGETVVKWFGASRPIDVRTY